MAGEHGAITFNGTRDLHQVSGPAGYPGPQLGAAKIEGSFNAAYANLFISLTTGVNDNNVYLDGYLVGNAYQGNWYWSGQSLINQGWFTASRNHSETPPPP